MSARPDTRRTAPGGELLEVDPQSYWAPFATHFPALGRHLRPSYRTACVLGGSDGKFVLPLLRAGLDVTAVDVDETFLFGGSVPTPEGELAIRGLRARLAEEGLEHRCEIVVADYMTWRSRRTFDVVVTSGSWSMPGNHEHDLAGLVGRAQELTAPGGVLFADYLAALPPHQEGEHYPPAERVDGLFAAAPWDVLEHADLGLCEERHYDKPEPHVHRFAAIIARRGEEAREVYLTDRAANDVFDSGVLLCDPLTRLVAYPSFERHLVEMLPRHQAQGVHLAIGDVDDLKAYVSRIDTADPSHFGHLAGNECMRVIGMATRAWADERLGDWPFAVCGTFGGDEVIVAAAGRPYASFVDHVRALAATLRRDAPRPMSFVTATLAPTEGRLGDPHDVYRGFVAQVDAQLFTYKADVRRRLGAPCGELLDVGVLSTRRS